MKSYEPHDKINHQFFILPLEDGNTAITYVEDGQVKLETWPLEAEVEDTRSVHEAIIEYINNYWDEYRLKVSLFKEMVRSLPSWAHMTDYDWLEEILKMSNCGKLPTYKDGLSSGQETLLKWLLFTIHDPKIIKIPPSSLRGFLEDAGLEESIPMPEEAYFLEYKEDIEGDKGYGLISPSPSEILTLILLYPERAKGLSLHDSYDTALQNLTSRETFALSGQTSPRYIAMLLTEYSLHPGIQQISEDSRIKKTSQAVYKISDPATSRPFAIFLYKVPVKVNQQKIYARLTKDSLIIFVMLSAILIGHTVFKIKSK